MERAPVSPAFGHHPSAGAPDCLDRGDCPGWDETPSYGLYGSGEVTTYSDVCRVAATLYDVAAGHTIVATAPADREVVELANAILGSIHREQASRLRALADLLDNVTFRDAVGTLNTDVKALLALIAPLSAP